MYFNDGVRVIIFEKYIINNFKNYCVHHDSQITDKYIIGV